MAEVKLPKSVRIVSRPMDGVPSCPETIITDAETGRPLELVTRATWQQDAHGTPVVALQFYGAEVDVIGDIAGLDRLRLAEAVVSAATSLLRQKATCEPHRLLDAVNTAQLQLGKLLDAVNAWRLHLGKEPLNRDG